MRKGKKNKSVWVRWGGDEEEEEEVRVGCDISVWTKLCEGLSSVVSENQSKNNERVSLF